MRFNSSDPTQTMQRVRVAMTGLALVVLLIGIAGAIFSAVDREVPVVAAGAPNSDVVANMTALNQVEEPLAELGVAPSKSEPVNVVVEQQPPAVDIAQ